MSNKVRNEGESIRQWRDRLRKDASRQNIVDGGELDEVIVWDKNPNNNITQGYKQVKFIDPNRFVGRSSLLGERKYRPNRSLATRLGNYITDAIGLTNPPTYTDGYGNTKNAEVPLGESAQGQELQRMGNTAMTATTLASIPFGVKYLYLSPLATLSGIGAGYAASKGVGVALDGVDKVLHTQGYQLTDNQKSIPQFVAGLVGGTTGFNWGTNATKRALEIAMHTEGGANPIPTVIRNFKRSPVNGKLNVVKYVLTGKNNNGTSNTLGVYIDPNTGEMGPGYYTGLTGVSNRAAAIGSTASADDMVQTYLYRKPLKNMTEITEPNSYGVHEKYISDTYPGKKIPVYEMEPQLGARTVPEDQVLSKSTLPNHSYIFGTGLDGKPIAYDAAGHIVETGKLATGETVRRQQDIWKFNSKDYMKRWLNPETSFQPETNPFKRGILKWGVDVVDHHGTPVVVRSPWIVQNR